jgi:hypothetical protein
LMLCLTHSIISAFLASWAMSAIVLSLIIPN